MNNFLKIDKYAPDVLDGIAYHMITEQSNIEEKLSVLFCFRQQSHYHQGLLTDLKYALRETEKVLKHMSENSLINTFLAFGDAKMMLDSEHSAHFRHALTNLSSETSKETGKTIFSIL